MKRCYNYPSKRVTVFVKMDDIWKEVSMIRKATLGFLLLLFASPCIFAGDIATFLNLGFSDDSRYFMFGQYGISDGTATPYAECYIVDVVNNAFATKGSISEKFSTTIDAGNNPIGAMLTLLGKNTALVGSYRISHLKPGRIVYVLIDGEKPLSSLEFRDFNTGTLYSVSLTQRQKGSGASVSSSFWIDLVATNKAGGKTSSKIGSPDYYRSSVKEYRIKYIILAPDGKSLVFVIEKSIVNGNGEDIRYMVETKKIAVN